MVQVTKPLPTPVYALLMIAMQLIMRKLETKTCFPVIVHARIQELLAQNAKVQKHSKILGFALPNCDRTKPIKTKFGL